MEMDVKTTFLSGYLEENVYMMQQDGFEDPDNPRKVRNLKKSIYGLNQSSGSQNLCFDEVIKMFDFIICKEERGVYQKFNGRKVTFLVLYVDDI